jgi:penicillin-binding protein 1C
LTRVFCLLSAVLLSASFAHALPSFEDVKRSYTRSDAVLLDRHGKPIQEIRVDAKGRRLEWVSIKDISPAMIRAVLESEDRRFYEHSGVDWKAAGAAALGNIFSRTQRGASTITMQLASMLEKGLKPKAKKRSPAQKWDQMQAALELEKSWKKNDILEAYLNLVFFRGELQGIAGASSGLFNKKPSGLDWQESAVLSSLIRSPNAPLGAVVARARVLCGAAGAEWKCGDVADLVLRTVSGPYAVRRDIDLAPHAARLLLKTGMQSAESTLDGDLQRFARETLGHHLSAVRAQNVRDGAVLVIENRSGEVLAYVANSGDTSSARHMDGIVARRQAGSTLKPFLYGLAFEQRVLTPASVLFDSPLDVPTVFGLYRPENYDNEFKGPVTARTALASSLNVPAVRTLQLAGTAAFLHRLRDLGFTRLEADEHYGYSAALGSVDVTLYELVNAYRALANNGLWSETKMVRTKEKPRKRRALSAEVAFIVSDILSDREARSATFSLENPLATRFWTAVKTGTSKDMRDNWCIGYSQKYTVGVWVGNFSGEPMWNVSGVTGAAPVWREVMGYLHAKDAGSPPEPPVGVTVHVVSAQDAGPLKKEFFLKGTEPVPGQSHAYESAATQSPRIIYPADGEIIALDPDIPEDLQRVFFESSPPGGSLRWSLNNSDIGAASEIVAWKPEPGSYTISLIGAKGDKVDSVHFAVRGNY